MAIAPLLEVGPPGCRPDAVTDLPVSTLLQRTIELFHKPQILFVSAIPEDQVGLLDILGSQYQLVAASTCQHAFERLRSDRISIVLCDRNLPDGTWVDLLDRISTSTTSAVLIVTCALAD